MTKTRLLQAVCTVALLAAAPAFAQTNTQTDTNGVANTPVSPTGSPNNSDMAPSGNMNTGGTMNSGSQASMGSRGTHHAMTHSGNMMHSRADSGDATVDQLNQQSYQAAHNGQAFNGASGSTATGSGSMNDMSGGSMSRSGSSMSGSGAPAGGTGSR